MFLDERLGRIVAILPARSANRSSAIAPNTLAISKKSPVGFRPSKQRLADGKPLHGWGCDLDLPRTLQPETQFRRKVPHAFDLNQPDQGVLLIVGMTLHVSRRGLKTVPCGQGAFCTKLGPAGLTVAPCG
jgi:hypothetical protein